MILAPLKFYKRKKEMAEERRERALDSTLQDDGQAAIFHPGSCERCVLCSSMMFWPLCAQFMVGFVV